MASIDKRPDGRYRTRWREYPGGPQKTRHFDRKIDAQQFLDGIRGDLAHGLYVDPAGGRTLFRTYAEEWRSCQVHRPSTAAQAETYLRLHAYPTLGNRTLDTYGHFGLTATTRRGTPSTRCSCAWPLSVEGSLTERRCSAVRPPSK
jgi:hypothetical protein